MRTEDGLALSSRNAYLKAEERVEAARLNRVLHQIKAAIQAGRRDFSQLERSAMAELDAHGWKTDYVAIRRQTNLQEPQPGDRALIILAASRLGTPRLIDNLEVIADSA